MRQVSLSKFLSQQQYVMSLSIGNSIQKYSGTDHGLLSSEHPTQAPQMWGFVVIGFWVFSQSPNAGVYE